MSNADIGPAGPAGPRGPRGETGDTGLQGPKGLQGPTGEETGPTGNKGPTGDKGPVGDQGPIGPEGVQGTVTGHVGTFGQCKLTRSSSSTLRLIPLRGNAIRINGVMRAIPSGGVTVTKGAALADTNYYVFASVPSATIVLTLVAATSHAPSTTAGNVGTEIQTGTDSQTLVGLVRMDASANFVDTPTQRFVRSWFNDDGVTAIASTATTKSVNSRSFIEIDTLAQVEVLTWANESFLAIANTRSFNTGGAWCYLCVWLNTAAVGSFGAVGNDGSNAVSFSNTAIASDVPTEGYNRFSIGAFSDVASIFHYERGVTVKTVRR